MWTYTHVRQQLDTEANERAEYKAKINRQKTIGKGRGIAKEV